ncbi:MAG: ferrous iron transport protein B [Porphyromonas sp.]|nr:ferrous iron transport protein B [Porphyromonas sp.]
MRLSDLQTGERGVIIKHHGDRAFGKRLQEMGFIPGAEILVVKNAPLKDPVEYRILGYDLALRRSEAGEIEVMPLTNPTAKKFVQQQYGYSCTELSISDVKEGSKRGERGVIKVAFIGNPNSGKTSLFNAASGGHEHVGNYSGVTVGAKSAVYKQDGYTFVLTDLPGTYAFSSYSPEERFVSQHLLGEDGPDVILNVVDSSNLERNLYLTTQIMEMSVPMVVALNMYDELERSGSSLDIDRLSELMGIPMTPTNGRKGEGITELFSQIIKLHDHASEARRVMDVRYDEGVERVISRLQREIESTPHAISNEIRPRFLALKLLEGDDEVRIKLLSEHPKGALLISAARDLSVAYEQQYHQKLQDKITNGRYGFVRGALQETYRADYDKITERNRRIDHILTSKVWGFPIFFLILFITFQLTFKLGEHPMAWIEMGVAWIGSQVGSMMSDGPLKDLLVDGVINGVGGVLVFLPNIIILYLCIGIMEDTGYLARAAFIMDKLMHGIGLHGKSFVPLLMGFGCSVPAVMATRTIESRNNRLLTILIVPFMSCGAKLPVYLLLAGAFFPHHAGTVLFGIYLLGVVLAILTALLLKNVLFTQKDSPFVMELPPYRIPTPRSVLLHMWMKAKQYLQKMGSVILFASIIIWALGYFPRTPQLHEEGGAAAYEAFVATHSDKEVENFVELMPDQQHRMMQQESSYIGQLGHAIYPIFKPLGYDWKMSVSLLTGFAAKEVVVSTMGVLYMGDAEEVESLPEKLKVAEHSDGSPVFNPAVALSFMVFVLTYLPCIATVMAISRESGSWRWALLSMVYSLTLAWLLGFAVTKIGALFF